MSQTPFSPALARSLVLGLLCLALWLPGFFTLPPFDRDEARFAQASHQMIESGDYVDIRFQEQPRHKKPVGIYWLQAASAHLAAAPEAIWAYRIPSLLGALVAVLLTAELAAILLSPRAGWLAGGLLASCLLLGVEARMAKTDAALLACVVLAQLPLLRLWLGQNLAQNLARGQAALFWLALAAGLLIKGPLILLALAGPLVGLIWRQRSLRPLGLLQPAWGVPLLLLMVLPWLIAITLRSDGAFWRESVGQDLAAKIASGQESHGAPPGYYLLTALLTFWPWAPLLLPALVLAIRRRNEVAFAFLLWWIIPFWLVFELIPTKLLHYTLPVFPALALLMAAALTEPAPALPRWLTRSLTGLGGALLAVVALGVPLAPLAVFAAMAPEPVAWRQILGAAPLPFLALASGLLLLVGALVAFSLRVRRPFLALTVAGFVLLNFYAAAFGQLLPGQTALWVSRSAAQMISPYRALCPDQPVASLGYAEPSLVFLLGTPTRLLARAHQLPDPDSCQLVLVESRQLGGEFVASAALDSVTGFNYSKGDAVTLYLFRREGRAP